MQAYRKLTFWKCNSRTWAGMFPELRLSHIQKPSPGPGRPTNSARSDADSAPARAVSGLPRSCCVATGKRHQIDPFAVFERIVAYPNNGIEEHSTPAYPGALSIPLTTGLWQNDQDLG